MVRKLILGPLIAGIVLVGVAAQAGAYLLAPPSPPPAAPGDGGGFSRFSDTGPHPVGLTRLDGDGAPLPMTVWYPAAEPVSGRGGVTYSYATNMLGPDGTIVLATYRGRADPGAAPDLADGPYPLVVLSPGFAIAGSSYGWLAEHLASHGFVVLSPEHDESLDPGLLWRSTVERPNDVLAVLAYVDAEVAAGGKLAGLIDTETVAVIGHSYGGYTALAAAGARIDTGAFATACESAYETDDPLVFLCDGLLPRMGDMAALAGLDRVPEGLWPAWADRSVDAAVSMAGDAAMFGQAGLAEVTVPVLAIGGTADTDSPFSWGTRPAYEYPASTRKVEIALEGAEHLVFAGNCESVRRIETLVSTDFCSDPAWEREHAHEIIAHYTTAFLLAELRDDAGAAAVLADQEPQIAKITYQMEGY